MPCSRKTIPFLVVAAILLVALVTSSSLAGCIACWQLKGIRIRLRDGTRITGYATWNQEWAELGYSWSNPKASLKQVFKKMKQFPEVIFDHQAQIDDIVVYTHLRSIKYPCKDRLVAIRKPIVVYVKEIQDLKLNPGPHDGYQGATRLDVVSPRIADLLQTKPAASCCYDKSVEDVCWVSYDKSFPAEELKRLCEQETSDEELEKRLKARDVFSLFFAYD